MCLCQVTAVDVVGLTVSDMDRALDLLHGCAAVRESVGPSSSRDVPYELLTGVFGLAARVVRLRLGTEEIELTEFCRRRAARCRTTFARTIACSSTSRSL